jgi:hypothetical protein
LSIDRSSNRWRLRWLDRCKIGSTSQLRQELAWANRLAYLIPAILFAVGEKKKAVISTHTINLQEQLTEKDLPMLSAVLGALPSPIKFNFTMLKGRAKLSLHPTPAKGHATEWKLVHLF